MLKKNTAQLDNGIFRVCIGYQYSAAKELRDYKKGNSFEYLIQSAFLYICEGNKDASFFDDSFLRALNRGFVNEGRENELAMKVAPLQPRFQPIACSHYNIFNSATFG